MVPPEAGETDAVVHLNTEITDPASLEADVLVIATGAHPRTLHVPGAERAMTATEFLSGERPVGDRVVVIGGGLTGCEIAYELALRGKHPAIVEMTPYLVGAKGICMANSSMLRELIRYHRIPAYLNAATQAITEEGVVVKTGDEIVTVPADSVILSVGYVPDDRFAAWRDGKTRPRNGPETYFIGDCDRVGSLKTVIRQAYDLVQKISYR